jgi:D-beta-D-heptose 7-phosphate kinase/D-beta-D-heptose 1-phosphate adenosyltransferase
MDKKRLVKYIDSFADLKCLVVGDVMLDHYIFGTTTRLSPEAPVPIVEVEEETYLPGGAANVSHNIVRLGSEVFLVGMTGDDEYRTPLIETLKEKKIGSDGIVIDQARPTTLKTRVVSKGQHLVRIDREVRDPIAGDIEKQLFEIVNGYIEDADLVLISDYAKGLLTAELVQRIIKLAKENDLPVIVDPKGDNFTKYRGSDLVTPNLNELQIVLGITVRDLSSLPQSAKMLLSHTNSDGVLITLGEKGMYYLDGKSRPHYLPAPRAKVVDISGAGDTAISVLALARAAGAGIEEAMYISTAACRVVIEKMGTATSSVEELKDSLKTLRLKEDSL